MEGSAGSMIYCVVPRELPAELVGSLQRHYRAHPGVVVTHERRGGNRRRSGERRAENGELAYRGDERRRIRNVEGRRIGERRALVVPASAPPLPRRARPFAERLTFLERLEPPSARVQDLEIGRLVTQIQSGEREAFTDLYLRFFDRVYTYLRVILRDSPDSEDAAQDVFIKVFEALPEYERRERPFEHWLFSVARNYAMNHLEKHDRLDVEDPAAIARRRTSEQDNADARVLAWLSDRDLLTLIDRLPLLQRQVLILRYMLDLPMSEIGHMLGRSPSAVRQLHHRAIVFLEERLTALGRTPLRVDRSSSLIRLRRAWVLRARRFSLVP